MDYKGVSPQMYYWHTTDNDYRLVFSFQANWKCWYTTDYDYWLRDYNYWLQLLTTTTDFKQLTTTTDYNYWLQTTDYNNYDYWIQLYWLRLVSAVTEEPIEIYDTCKVWFPHHNIWKWWHQWQQWWYCDDDDITITMTSTMKTMTLKDHLKTTHSQL